MEIELKDHYLKLAGKIQVGDFIEIKKTLKEFDRSKILEIFLQTQGGVLVEALNIGLFLDDFNTMIHPYEKVHSAGVLILMVGKQRPGNLLQTNPTFLFHIPTNIETKNKVDDGYISNYAGVMSYYLKISEDEIAQLLKEEKKISVQKAKEIGLVDSNEVDFNR